MGKKKSSGGGGSSSSSVPAPPPPATEYFYDDGFLRGQRLYQTNNGAPVFFNSTFSTPDEQAIEQKSTQLLRGLVDRGADVDFSPQGMAAYRETIAAPQRAALNESYNLAKGAATNNAVTSGTRDSVGFNRYLASEIERNRAQGLADIENNAVTQQYNLPRLQLQGLSDAFNLFNAAKEGEQATSSNSLNAVMQGNQLSNSTLNNIYQSQLQQRQLQANLEAQRRAQSSSGGNFFSRLLFGG